jgi:hypothetical protein
MVIDVVERRQLFENELKVASSFVLSIPLLEGRQ